MASSELERAFKTLWIQLNGPALEEEYRFYPTRRWRFDFAHPKTKTAIECEGGTWTGGRHTRGAGFSKDCEKYNMAAANGWRVFRLTSDMLDDDPFRHLTQIIAAVEGAIDNLEEVTT